MQETIYVSVGRNTVGLGIYWLCSEDVREETSGRKLERYRAHRSDAHVYWYLSPWEGATCTVGRKGRHIRPMSVSRLFQRQVRGRGWSSRLFQIFVLMPSSQWDSPCNPSATPPLPGLSSVPLLYFPPYYQDACNLFYISIYFLLVGQSHYKWLPWKKNFTFSCFVYCCKPSAYNSVRHVKSARCIFIVWIKSLGNPKGGRGIQIRQRSKQKLRRGDQDRCSIKRK